MTDKVPTDAELLTRAKALRSEADDLEDQARRTTRLYCAGPMTNMPEWNFPAFREAARQLREAGYDVVDPSEKGGTEDAWELNMRRALTEMLTCDGVATLPNWAGSKGARIEVKLARDLGIPVTWVDTWLAEATRQTEGDG